MSIEVPIHSEACKNIAAVNACEGSGELHMQVAGHGAILMRRMDSIGPRHMELSVPTGSISA